MRSERRSKGYGAKLLAWLKEFAAKEDFEQLYLDSATWREEAHRFYEREGLRVTIFHFSVKIDPKRIGPGGGEETGAFIRSTRKSYRPSKYLTPQRAISSW